jgi:hypothetical protein
MKNPHSKFAQRKEASGRRHRHRIDDMLNNGTGDVNLSVVPCDGLDAAKRRSKCDQEN